MVNPDKGGSPGKGLFRRLAEQDNIRKILLFAGIGAIVLIFLSSFFSHGRSNEAQPELVQKNTVHTEDYISQLEENLTRLIGGIDGVGKVDVMITLEKGVEYVYATQEKKSKQTTENKASDQDVRNQAQDQVETSYIIVKDADGAQKALEVTEVQPVVKGVVVVCEGGDNPTVQQNVTEAVTTALNLSSARVCVVKSKS